MRAPVSDLDTSAAAPKAIIERVAAGLLGAATGVGLYEHTPHADDEVRERMRQIFNFERAVR